MISSTGGLTGAHDTGVLPHPVQANPAPQVMTAQWDWQTHLNLDQTHISVHHGPCETLAQRALTVLDSESLTPSQGAVVAKDLLCVVERMLVEQGCTARYPITFNGKTKYLNALQLTYLRAALTAGQSEPSLPDMDQAWNSLRETTALEPDALTRLLTNIAGGQNTMTASTQPLSAMEQSMAEAVISILPSVVQGRTQNMAAQLLGRQSYIEVMNRAADHPDFPAVLKQFHQAAQHCPGIRLALKSQPSVAFALLFPGEYVTPAISPPNYCEQVAKKLAPSRLISLADKLPSSPNGSLAWNKVMHAVFENLDGFGAQNAAQVPSCFNTPCPAHTLVKVDGLSAGVHANVVCERGPGVLIAAMQPVTVERTGPIHPADLKPEERTNVANFLRMAAGQIKPTIVDLRSASELSQGKGFEYCPEHVGQTHQFNDISITTTHIETVNPDLRRLTVRVDVEQEDPVELTVTQYRGWSDRGVVGPETLQMLGKQVASDQRTGASVIAHGRAGVGRTGTVLAYAGLQQKLIHEGQAQALYSQEDTLEPSLEKLIEHVVAEVVNGRVQRGPLFVQLPKQFRLLANTLLQDVYNWWQEGSVSDPESGSTTETQSATRPATSAAPSAAPEITPAPLSTAVPEITAAPESPTAVSKPDSSAEKPTLRATARSQENQRIGLNINQIRLVPEHAFTMAQEPKNKESKWLYLHSLFNRGSDVLEFVSDPNRLAKFASIPQPHGVNILSPIVLNQFNNPAEYGPPPEIVVGKFRINHVQQTVDALNKNGCLAYTYQFDVTNTETGVEKSVRHVQIYSEFNNKRISKIQLKAMLNLADQCQLNQNNLWLSSSSAIGRPSAWLMARHIDDAILANKMTKRNCRHLIDSWIKAGREQSGPRFVHSTAQKEELVQLALDLLKNKKSTPNQEPPASRQLLFKKSKTFGQRISSFPELVSWIKRHLHPGKTTTPSPPPPVSTNPPS